MTHVKQKPFSIQLTTVPVIDKLIQVVEIKNDAMPDLNKANVVSVDLASDYWQPVTAGESKRVVFDRIDTCKARDFNNPDVLIDLVCVFFFERVNGKIKSISNGSKRLVSSIQNLMSSPHSPFEIVHGSLLEITFKGKVKNKTNSFSSDRWGIRPIILNIKSNDNVQRRHQGN